MKVLSLLFYFATWIAFGQSPTCQDLVGDWENPLGSTLRIETVTPMGTDYGKIEGKYKSPSGTSGSWKPLVGYYNVVQISGHNDQRKVLAFSVQWEDYGSITSWSCVCRRNDRGVPEIFSTWNLVRANSSFKWDHILTGSDTFWPK